MNKSWYTSKTIHSAIAKLVAGLGMALQQGDWAWVLLSLWGVYDAWVRFHTTTGVGR